MNAETIGFGSALVKMVGGLAIVLALVFLLAYFMKKLSGVSSGAGDNSLLRIISSHRIGPKQVIALYQVGNRAFLIGISQDNITFLTDVALEDLELKSSNPAPDGKISDKNFADRLRGFMNFSVPASKKEMKA